MKFDLATFNRVCEAPHYEGVDAYLIDDDKNQVPYHIYMFLVETETLAAIIVKKMPVGGAEYQIFEFNGNKMLEHKSVRVKELSPKTDKFQKLIKKFEAKDFVFQD